MRYTGNSELTAGSLLYFSEILEHPKHLMSSQRESLAIGHVRAMWSHDEVGRTRRRQLRGASIP